MSDFPTPFVLKDPEPCDEPESCDFIQQLPTALKDATVESAFLRKYVHRLPIEEIGLPAYREDLERSDSDAEKPNFIYNLFSSQSQVGFDLRVRRYDIGPAALNVRCPLDSAN